MNRSELLKILEDLGAFEDKNKLKLKSGFTRRLVKNHPEVLNNIKNIINLPWKEEAGPSEIIYNLVHSEINHKCPVCGNYNKRFSCYSEGYKECCCRDCASKLMVQRFKETNLKKYGVAHPMHRQEVKNKLAQTNLERYGSACVFAVDEVKNKIKQTNLERYGVDNPNKNEDIREKIKKTNLERYGAEHALQNKEILGKVQTTNIKKYGNVCSLHGKEQEEKAKKTNLERYGAEFVGASKEIINKVSLSRKEGSFEKLLEWGNLGTLEPLFSKEEYLKEGSKGIYKFRCKTCGQIFLGELKQGLKPVCPKCFPKTEGTSNQEREVDEFVSSLYKGAINYNYRKLIKPDNNEVRELDIYLPDEKFAIEYDGVYFHTESQGKDKNYHLDKTKACENLGINLLHIFSDEWVDVTKKQIIKSLIRDYLKTYEYSIKAEDCEIKEVQKEEAEDFTNNNYIFGYNDSTYNIGLYYKGEIVSLLGIINPTIKSIRGKDGLRLIVDWQIQYFCNKININVENAFKILLDYFRNNHKGSIIGFVNRAKFNGNIFREYGFEELDPTEPKLFYTKYGYKRYSLNTIRTKFKNELNDPKYSNLNENEIMQLQGYDRIWDCGNWKFYLN